MAKIVIRKNVDGFDVDFGTLVIAELAGIKFATEDWRATQLDLSFVETEEPEDIPAFLDDLKVVINWGNTQIYVYPFNKADIKPLGLAFSAHRPDCRIDVQHRARILMMWEGGGVTCEQRTIDEFYLDMTPEEIERSRF